MGDILLATPLIRWMRKRFPQAQIDFAVRERFRGLLQGNPQINNLRVLSEPADFNKLSKFTREIRRLNYDAAIDIHTNLRSRFLCSRIKAELFRWKPPRLKRWLLVNWKKNLLCDYPPVPLRYLSAVEDLGVKDDRGGLEFFIPLEAEERCREILRSEELEDKVIIAIAPGAKWFTKRWSAERFTQIGRKLVGGHCDALLFMGGEDEFELCHTICGDIKGKTLNLAGKTDFGLAGAVMEKCAAFIGNDSGLSHLAAAVKVPSVVIFGPTVKEFGFFPFRNKSVILERELYCRPCSHIGGDRCPEKHFRCMEEIEVEDVLSAVDELLKGD